LHKGADLYKSIAFCKTMGYSNDEIMDFFSDGAEDQEEVRYKLLEILKNISPSA
jgi:hypothetical protein